MFGYNIGVATHGPLKFDLVIKDFPSAIKIQDGEMDGKIIKSFDIYSHPDFIRYTPDWGTIDWVQVLEGRIIGPYFQELKPAQELENKLLAL